MHQFQKRLMGACCAHTLDQPEGDTAAAMRSQSGGFVDRHQMLVFEQDRWHRSRRNGSQRSRRALCKSHRRNPHLIAGRQAIVHRHPALVHPDLTGPHNAIDVALWHPLGDPDQVVVEPLSLCLGPDGSIGSTVGGDRLQLGGMFSLPRQPTRRFAGPRYFGFTGSAHLAYTRAVGAFAKQLKATEPASRRL